MEIQSSADESLAIIEKLRHNIENIHKVKLNKWTKELSGLLLQNKSLIMNLRKKQRELAEKVEKAKDELAQVAEKTDGMHAGLENLKYEKVCIENETCRIRKMDIKELKNVGIDVSGEKEQVLERLAAEFRGRNELKDVALKKETELETEKKLLACVDAKARILMECFKRIHVASEGLAVHVTTDEMQVI